jgi:hypothetical protein
MIVQKGVNTVTTCYLCLANTSLTRAVGHPDPRQQWQPGMAILYGVLCTSCCPLTKVTFSFCFVFIKEKSKGFVVVQSTEYSVKWSEYSLIIKS